MFLYNNWKSRYRLAVVYMSPRYARCGTHNSRNNSIIKSIGCYSYRDHYREEIHPIGYNTKTNSDF